MRIPKSAPFVALLLVIASSCAGAPPTTKRPADLLNPFLGPEHATWLEGAIARMATPDEIAGFQQLRDDAAAAAFIDAFWERRNPHPGERNVVRETFEKRAAEADKRFSESGRRGRATDRGAVFVLYGEPAEIKFDAGVGRRELDAEVWLYREPLPRGLHGHVPQPQYRFARVGDVTVYVGAAKRPVIEHEDQQR